MSDPVSNAEVEDVLASIRRLVSEEKRPQASRPSAHTPPSGAESGSDTGKLVLTPSLRVMEPDKSDAKSDTTPEDAVTSAEEAQSENPDIAQIIASQEEAAETDAAPEIAEAPMAEDVPLIDQDALAAENARTAARLVQALQDAQPEADAETETDMAGEQAVATEADPATDERVADAVASSASDAEDDLPAEAGGETAADMPDTPEAPVAEPGSESAEPADAAGAAPSRSLSAKIAALEAAIGKRHDEWEPDGVVEDEPLSGTAASEWAWEDHVETTEATPAMDPESMSVETDAPHDSAAEAEEIIADAEAEQMEAAEEAAELISAEATDETDQDTGAHMPDELTDFSHEPALLDEEALQDMVAEIVRQELQGALGERITRNVRKLVRREIQRALAAHDLD